MTVLLGRTVSGTTADSNASGAPTGHPFVAAVSGVLATIYCQPKVTNGTVTEFELGIYADSAGAPGALLGRAVVSAGFTGVGPFSATGFAVPITAGTTYYLATLTSGAGFSWQGDASGGNYRERTVGGLTDLPDPMGTVFAAQGTGLVIWGEDAPAARQASPLLSMLLQGGLQRAKALLLLHPPQVASALTTVSDTRAIKYDLTATQSATRAVKYDLLEDNSATRAVRYDLLASVNSTRAIKYDLTGTTAATRAIKYDLTATVSATRAVRYDLQQVVSGTRAVRYDLLELNSDTRAVKYDLVGSVSASRGIRYDVVGTTTSTRDVRYDIAITSQPGRTTMTWVGI